MSTRIAGQTEEVLLPYIFILKGQLALVGDQMDDSIRDAVVGAFGPNWREAIAARLIASEVWSIQNSDDSKDLSDIEFRKAVIVFIPVYYEEFGWV